MGHFIREIASRPPGTCCIGSVPVSSGGFILCGFRCYYGLAGGAGGDYLDRLLALCCGLYPQYAGVGDGQAVDFVGADEGDGVAQASDSVGKMVRSVAVGAEHKVAALF